MLISADSRCFQCLCVASNLLKAINRFRMAHIRVLCFWRSAPSKAWEVLWELSLDGPQCFLVSRSFNEVNPYVFSICV